MENLQVYIISCADWITLAEGKSSEDAATKAFEHMTKLKGKNLKVSPVIEVTNLSEVGKDIDLSDYSEFVYCPKIMADAGHHGTAKAFSNLLDK